MRVSIITISLNPGPAVQRTVDAIVSQTYSDVQWIVIDGSSTDGTLDVYERHRERIDVLSVGKDGGIADAMNKGLAAVTGDAVMFINAGDALADEHTLEHVVRAWDAERYAWATGGTLMLTEDESLVGQRLFVDVAARDLVRRDCYICHVSTIARTSLFREHGGFDTRFGATMDYEVLLRWLALDYQPQLLPFVVSRYYVGGTSSNTLRRYRECRFARRLHGVANPAITEWRLGALAMTKHLLAPLRKHPAVYRLKEKLCR